MKLTQFLIFEVCRDCNLGHAHSRCPNLHPERCAHCDKSTPLSDEKIVDIAEDLYKNHGFVGYVGFHYYNEPLMAAPRMFRLIEMIRARTPAARFVLWTNGTLLPQEPAELERFRAFDLAWVTKYDNADYKQIKSVIPNTQIVTWRLDGRRDNRLPAPRSAPCTKMFNEIVFDYFGNVHICCNDWRGEAKIGNVHSLPLAELVKSFQDIRYDMAVSEMLPGTPDVCFHCAVRQSAISYLAHDIAMRAKGAIAIWRAKRAAVRLKEAREREATRVEMERIARRPASIIMRDFIILIAYRIPARRVEEHFHYNAALYRESGAKIIIIVEKPYPAEIVQGAQQIVYSGPMEKFSNPICKNFGIRFAIDSGARVVIAADIDVVFSPECLKECLNVEPNTAIVPVFQMIQTMEEKGTIVRAVNATGVVAMLADDWRCAHYHEKSAGYGADDSLLLTAIRRTGRKIVRARGDLWHLAHIPGTPQKEFCAENPRVDHWGRAEGFHPEAFRENNKLQRAEPLDLNPLWGLPPGWRDIAFVVTHYRMPEERLRDFLEWNGDGFRRIGARLIIVSDCERENLPAWARLAVYPQALTRFNLAATSNFGIRNVGQGIICKSDPDCIFSSELLDAVAKVSPRAGLCPMYLMAEDASEEARKRARSWDASKGTLALHWEHWSEINGFDDRMVGYGIEDGDCFHRAGHTGSRSCERVTLPLWHVAHSNISQGSGNRRKDLWGGASGFNPNMHGQNQKVRRDPYVNPVWGRP